jgi:cellulose synthase/poly-beta-1,6-N-acetylglucosamine synthase-like glycosyltransferase
VWRGTAARRAESEWRRGWVGPDATPSDYDFLVDRLIDRATLERAEELAWKWGVLPHAVMIANGWVREADYYRELARSSGVSFHDHLPPHAVALPAPLRTPRDSLAAGLLKQRAWPGAYIFAPAKLRPNAVKHVLARLEPHRIGLAAPRAVRDAIHGHFAPSFATAAVGGLHARHPERSAREKLAAWQRLACWLLPLALTVMLAVEAWPSLRVLSFALAFVFLPTIGLRLFAVHTLCRGRSEAGKGPPLRIADAELPVYTLLVPLYREANMVAGLAGTLARLDYPAAKLDVRLILEEVDTETVALARALDLPGNVEIVVVPDLQPRTKPKALNYALPLARGEYVVIYDAEDRPEPDQLRKAVAAFRRGPANLACLQARLGLYNAAANWLTRQFTIEYGALFDGLLPALERLKLPIPLGGTSNHFRIEALKWLMAWDPFNVTEDADLGTRLARSGYSCQMLSSTTFEEAPVRLATWLRQRTRWIKGYMQTWLVHMRHPATLWRELGPAGFFGFQAMVGATVLSALVHPWIYVLAAVDLANGAFLTRPGLLGLPFWIAAALGLAAGYLAAMALGFVAIRRRGMRKLLVQVPLMPLYWLIISAAAYRALWQFAFARFSWEKTEHGVAGRTRQAARRKQARPSPRLGSRIENWSG